MNTSGKATMEVLSSSSKWFGVTYADDKPYVQKSIKELVDKGEYPSPLANILLPYFKKIFLK